MLGNPNSLLDPDNLWTAETNRGFYILGSLQRINQYDAQSSTISGFVSAKLKLSEACKATLGIRFENYALQYTEESIDQVIYNTEELIDVNDFFLSINIIRSLSEQTNLRFSCSKTTARPSFKKTPLLKYSIQLPYDILLGI